MNLLLDSFWRAVVYCLRPRIVLLALLPLVLVIVLTLGMGVFFWDAAVDQVFHVLESSVFVNNGWAWLDSMGLGHIKTALAPLVVIFVVTPVIVVVSLLLVALLMTPFLVQLVARRRFAGLERHAGGTFWRSLGWAVGSALMALLAIVVSIPLWFVPPLVLVLPPLIWGWLTYRVMAFDALAAHATQEERHTIFRRHRSQLLAIGVLAGYMASAPSLVWASGGLFAVGFVILAPLAIWIYTLVFVFSSLWFAHYCLAALHALRGERSPIPAAPDAKPEPTPEQEPLALPAVTAPE